MNVQEELESAMRKNVIVMDQTHLLESSRRKEKGEPGRRGAGGEKGEAGQAAYDELGR